MMGMAFYQGHRPQHPFPSLVKSLQRVNEQRASAYSRIKLLDDVVVLNAGTLAQYQKLKLKMNTMFDFISACSATEKQERKVTSDGRLSTTTEHE